MAERIVAVAALFAAALLGTPAAATTPSSANYAIPSSTMNAGVGDMSSASYKLSSSLGDSFYTGAMGSTSYQLNPGFWGAVIGPLPLCLLDVDGNGSVDALTDGLMILRAMFGLTGTSVTNGAVGPNASRTTWALIQPYIHMSALDLDGNGTTDALTDGLMLLRAMFGLTGTSVTNGAIGLNPQRANWSAVRAYLNSSCGASFSQ